MLFLRVQPPFFTTGTAHKTVSERAADRTNGQQPRGRTGRKAGPYPGGFQWSPASHCHRSCLENTGIMEARCGGGERRRWGEIFCRGSQPWETADLSLSTSPPPTPFRVCAGSKLKQTWTITMYRDSFFLNRNNSTMCRHYENYTHNTGIPVPCIFWFS